MHKVFRNTQVIDAYWEGGSYEQRRARKIYQS